MGDAVREQRGDEVCLLFFNHSRGPVLDAGRILAQRARLTSSEDFCSSGVQEGLLETPSQHPCMIIKPR